ncbi:MAG: HD domain-containing protein [Verrucomicrobiota bacterium]
MRTEALANLRKWFRHYIRQFTPKGARMHPLLQLKLRHSERVAQEARALASDLGWPPDCRNAAEALGLLHDIGRFAQFAAHRTFADARSFDHGECGWEITRKTAPLSGLPRAERERILDGIRYHNRRVIPDTIAPRRRVFINLIRDADKLDIFRVTLESVARNGFQDLPEMLPGITLGRAPSPAIIRELRRRQTCSLRKIESLGDFFVMQLSWIYDLCYMPTYRRVVERRILPRILGLIDGNVRVQDLGIQLNQWITSCLQAKPAKQRCAKPACA